MAKTKGANGVRLDPKHTDRTRAKIQTSQLINRLFSFVNGEVKMEAAQVTAALGLLKKTLPDLSAVDMNTVINDKRSAAEYTRQELADIISNAANGSARTSGANGCAEPTDKLH